MCVHIFLLHCIKQRIGGTQPSYIFSNLNNNNKSNNNDKKKKKKKKKKKE